MLCGRGADLEQMKIEFQSKRWGKSVAMRSLMETLSDCDAPDGQGLRSLFDGMPGQRCTNVDMVSRCSDAAMALGAQRHEVPLGEAWAAHGDGDQVVDFDGKLSAAVASGSAGSAQGLPRQQCRPSSLPVLTVATTMGAELGSDTGRGLRWPRLSPWAIRRAGATDGL